MEDNDGNSETVQLRGIAFFVRVSPDMFRFVDRNLLQPASIALMPKNREKKII